MSNIITHASPGQEGLPGVEWSTLTDGSRKEQKARALCSALWEQSKLSAADKAAVEKYLVDLSVFLT